MSAAARGDKDAADQLLPMVYSQLRKAAQMQLESERPGHTLSATALVHEAYIKLVGPRDIAWADRGHFYAAAAQAMRRILIDRARARHGRNPTSREARLKALVIAGIGTVDPEVDAAGLLALDDALSRLEKVDSQAASVVRLRFYAGLDINQTASALGISDRTVKRDWTFARGWLREDLERSEDL